LLTIIFCVVTYCPTQDREREGDKIIMVCTKTKKGNYIIVTCNINKEDDTYVAVCPELDVASQGESVEEANNNVKEAILLYLNSIDELGTMKKIFKERKIKIYSEVPEAKKEKISIPKNFNNDSFTTINPIPLAC
jgi:predicted RNase H-like HicB family nuclease